MKRLLQLFGISASLLTLTAGAHAATFNNRFTTNNDANAGKRFTNEVGGILQRGSNVTAKALGIAPDGTAYGHMFYDLASDYLWLSNSFNGKAIRIGDTITDGDGNAIGGGGGGSNFTTIASGSATLGSLQVTNTTTISNAQAALLSIWDSNNTTALVIGGDLSNHAPATLSFPPRSPAWRFNALGFQSGASTYTNVGMFFDLETAFHATTPSGTLRLWSQIGNAASNVTAWFTTAGDANFTGSMTAGQYVFAGASQGVGWSSSAQIYRAGPGDFVLSKFVNAGGAETLSFGGGSTVANAGLTTNFPSLRMESGTNDITLGVRKGTNRMPDNYANLTAGTITANASGALPSFAFGLATGAGFYHGSGSPESVVAAQVGSFYTRTNGGASTVLYVKESGTGNTGWIAK